ncbi:ABC transporter ATP-binding protein [Granulosicoccus antarcticus]|uniref:Hemin import ATP-binding protein HmuV n=1 Tax=Granulosicoccus antarcticus IMCC3135 TaxID=1192854 RepID=A0A2Z2P526_9GAMM|nr:ABC transporter ATP-binding protein [Granulosicoccus antarcticus]ASJ74934.1 Hemin import ATP-binding protein HmuV [Granulosicoccus antarcticus IMCC3135]
MSDQLRLQASSVSITRSERTIVSDVSLQVFAGELVGLIGPNGAGKSTLLAALAGIDTTVQGSIELDGCPLKNLSATERALQIAWIEQMGSVNWPVTVERLVMLGRIPHLPVWCRATQEDTQAVESALSLSDCQSLRLRQVNTLSGGERARVLLARALAAEPSLLFADEPISTLDLGHQLQTMQLLRDFASGPKAAVVVMHDLSLAARYCDRLYLMHEGRMAAAGEIAQVLSAQNLARVYGVSAITGHEKSVPWIIPLERLS